MLDTARDYTPRKPSVTEYAEMFAGIKGRVLILGAPCAAITALIHNEEISEIIVFARDEHERVSTTVSAEGRAGGKVKLVARAPWGILRRDIDHKSVNLMIVDTMQNPWDGQRTDAVRALCKEFYPEAVVYNWQELDICAEWLAAGYDPESINRSVFPLFTASNKIPVIPRSDKYAKEALEVAMSVTRKAAR